MLRVTVPHFQRQGEWTTFEAPESAESYIRQHIINQYPPVIQVKCKIEQFDSSPVSTTEPPLQKADKPKTKARLKLEEKAEKLGILGINLYPDDKLKERIILKENKLNQPQPKKRGRPKKIS